MQKCIRENGAVLSSAFAKLGIVIPVTASILFLGEIPTLFQLVGPQRQRQGRAEKNRKNQINHIHL